MKALLKSIFAAFLLVFISCNPDEELDNNGNSGNNGNSSNNGNNGGGGSAMSYPEVINLLAGNWYGEGHEVHYTGGNVASHPQNTMSVGYLTFGSSIAGTANFDFPDGFLDPSYSSLLVNKYPASVTIVDGSWSGSGSEWLRLGFNQELAKESNYFPDKSYCVVEYTTPFFDINTPTIQYAIKTSGWLNPGVATDISLFAGYTEMRIHTLNSTTLKLVTGSDGFYYMVTYTRLP
jgi:hypothetical protein